MKFFACALISCSLMACAGQKSNQSADASNSDLASVETQTAENAEPAYATIYGDNAVSLSVANPAMHLFVSYPGRLGDKCGIKMFTLGHGGVLDLSSKILVQAEDLAIGGGLVTLNINDRGVYDFKDLVLDQSYYGIYIRITTKDGSNLADLATSQIIVVGTPCP